MLKKGAESVMSRGFRGRPDGMATSFSRFKIALLVTAVMITALVASALTVAAADAMVDIRLNGKLFPGAGLVLGDRTYVNLADVAESIGGRYTYDSDLNVAFVQSGAYLNLNHANLARINPKLRRHYSAAAPLSGIAGVEYTAPGPSLNVVTARSGEALAISFSVSADASGHYRWFDQAAGAPIRTAAGNLYTQHLYVVDPAIVQGGQGTKVAFNGELLDLPADALIWHEGALYARLRELAQASGGGVGWDVATRTASAKIVPGSDLSFDKLVDYNDVVNRSYRINGDFTPGVGYYVGPRGPGIVFSYDQALRVVAFAAVYGEEVEWNPWFDQSRGALEDFPGHGPSYTIHHYVTAFDEIVAP